MSKSKGEFLTVSLLEQKGYDPLAYRLFCLQSHYRRALVFSYENLDNAAAAYQKMIARIAALNPADDTGVDSEAFSYTHLTNLHVAGKQIQQLHNDRTSYPSKSLTISYFTLLM